jgi:hypothetical protein
MAATIKQRHERDCFLCCIAMVAGLTYEQAAEKWGAEFVAEVGAKGLTGSKRIDHAFGAVGLERDVHYRVLFMLPEYAALPFLRNVLWGRRALFQVRSKNNPGEHHIVFWDGAALHDPSNKRTYAWEEAEPIYVWIFDERPLA